MCVASPLTGVSYIYTSSCTDGLHIVQALSAKGNNCTSPYAIPTLFLEMKCLPDLVPCSFFQRLTIYCWKSYTFTGVHIVCIKKSTHIMYQAYWILVLQETKAAWNEAALTGHHCIPKFIITFTVYEVHNCLFSTSDPWNQLTTVLDERNTGREPTGICY